MTSTAKNGGWTLDTLKTLMDEREKAAAAAQASAERAVAAALAAAEKAVLVAERNAEKWRDSANEWRAAMTDKDRNFVTKSVLWGYFAALIGLVTSLTLLLRVFAK
jgi:hypothetical protein